MSSTLNKVIISLFSAFSIVFLVSAYLSAHVSYGDYLIGLFIPLLSGDILSYAASKGIIKTSYLFPLLLLPLFFYGVLLTHAAFTKKDLRLSFFFTPILGVLAVIFSTSFLFLLFSTVPEHGVFSTYENPQATYERLYKAGTIPKQLQTQENQEALSQYVLSKREIVPNTLEKDPHPLSLWSGLGQFILSLTLLFSGLLFLLLSLYSLGATLLERLRLFTREQSSFAHLPFVLLSLGIGFTSILLILFLLAFFHILTPVSTWILFLLPLLSYKRAWEFLRGIFVHKISIESSPLSFGWISGSVLFLLITITVHHLFRPFPIGWDDLGVYMNLPKLIASYHGLVPGFASYSWSLFMSTGFLLFNSATFTLFLSWLGGILSLLAIYGVGRILFRPSIALTLCTLFYSLPAVQFQSSQDMKVDMALFFFCTLSFLTFLLWWKEQDQDTHPEGAQKFLSRLCFWKKTQTPFPTLTLKTWQTFLLIALLLGISFSIKYTAFLFIVALGLMILYTFWGVAGIILLLSLVGLLQGVLHFSSYTGIVLSAQTNSLFLYLGLLGVVGSMGALLARMGKSFVGQLLLFITMCLVLLVPVAPWMIKNGMEAPKISLSLLLNGRIQSPNPYLEPLPASLPTAPVSSTLPSTTTETSVLSSSTATPDTSPAPVVPAPTPEASTPPAPEPASQETGRDIELRRYIGYEQGLLKYLSLPYDITMNTNVFGEYVDISFLFLLLLVIGLLFLPKKHALLLNILLAGTLGLGLLSIHHQAILDTGSKNLCLPEIKAIADARGVDVAQLKDSQKLLLSACSTFYEEKRTAELEAKKTYFAEKKKNPSTPRPSFPTLENPRVVPFLSATHSIFRPLYTGVIGVLSQNLATPSTSIPAYLLLLFLIGLSIAVLLCAQVSRLFTLLGKGALLYWILWMLLASGVTWYGITGFLFFLLFIGALLSLLSAEKDPFLQVCRQVIFALFMVWFGMSLLTRMHTVEIPAFAFYKAGVFTEDETIDNVLPSYSAIKKEINSNPDLRVYRVGSFVPYFLTKNDQRVLTDNQLDIFRAVYLGDSPENKKAFVDQLKREGFGYIVFDLNTGTIDASETRLLIRSVQSFLTFVNNNPHLTLVASDIVKKDVKSFSAFRPGRAMLFYKGTSEEFATFSPDERGTIPAGTTAIGEGDIIVWKLN